MDCIFCKIVHKEIPGKIVKETDRIVAFYDIAPQAPVHILIIPKKHMAGIGDMTRDDRALIGDLFYEAGLIARELKIRDYRLVINNGKEAGQAVFHLHLHLLAGRKFAWPPG